MANTPGRLVAMVASVIARPARSTSTPIWATSGAGRTPPVQMTVRVGMVRCASPSPMTTSFSRTSLMGMPVSTS